MHCFEWILYVLCYNFICFTVHFTKLDLAKFYKGKGRITVVTFPQFKLQNHQTPVVKMGLANHQKNNRRNLSDSRQLTTSLSTTIGNNKREILISSLSHLRATQTCESTIKGLYNSCHLQMRVRANSTLLCIFFSYVLTKDLLLTNLC